MSNIKIGFIFSTTVTMVALVLALAGVITALGQLALVCIGLWAQWVISN